MDPSQTMPPRQARYFRRFLAYALDYKGLLAVAIVMGVLKFGLNYIYPWLIGTAIDMVVAPGADAAALVQSGEHVHWADQAFSRGHGPVGGTPIDVRVHWLEFVLVLGVIFAFAHGIATYGRGYFTAKLGNRVIRDLRQDLFDHLHRLSLHFYSKERTGSIVSRLMTDIQQASQLINGGIITVVMDSASILIALCLLLPISWKLTVACLAILPLYGITFKVLNPRVKQASLRVQSQISKISGSVQERLAGIALVKTYAAEQRESEKFQADTEEHYGRVLHQTNLSQLVGAISECLVHIGSILVVAVGGYMALFEIPALTAGELTKALGYLALMYQPVRRFAEVNLIYQGSLAAIERVFQVFDITPKIVERAKPIAKSPQQGRVHFEHVNFDYLDESDESQVTLEEHSPIARHARRTSDATGVSVATPSVLRRWVLEDLDFVVSPGERVALVGPSGGGKTTLVSLLPRLYDVSQGRILIDDVDVRDYRLRSLRRAIGIVQQDSFLFSGTIRENIIYGRPDATQEQVVAAAKAANAHDFISALPDHYESIVGERGITLSGGQRQRMSIARAILKDPRILILDEATSALDSESESLVQEALNRLMQGRTCFIIAHRLSTVRHVDRILVLCGGKVVESGRHDELVTGGGLYARLVRQQFGPQAAQTVRAG